VLNVSSDLEMQEVLTRIVRSACELVGAKYGALGVLDPGAQHLVEFITTGMTEKEQAAIEHPPRGLGVLGLLVADPRPRRIPDLRRHPDALGFPPGHPVMRSFLGAPIRVRGEVFGNLYLTEKVDGGAFTESDESVLIALAAATGVAIDNARRYGTADRERQWSEAVSDISQLLLGGEDDTAALELVVERAAAVADAPMAVVAVADDSEDLVIRAAVGPDRGRASTTVGSLLASSHWREVLNSREPLLLVSHPGEPSAEAIAGRLRRSTGLELHGATAVVPMATGPRSVGLLIVGWPQSGSGSVFEAVGPLERYAGEVALTLIAAQAQRDREMVALLEDRHRIARDMHDVVIQQLYATGLSLQSASQLRDRGALQRRVDAAVDELDIAIKEIRRTILDLNAPQISEDPVDELRGLVSTFRRILGFTPRLRVSGDLEHLDEKMLGHVVAVVRESLSNIARHSKATKASVRIWAEPGRVRVKVSDDGVGIAPDRTRRSGLANLGERAVSTGGVLNIVSAPGEGTMLEWSAGG
jgi:signal transduction histidine kinase